MRLCTLGQLTLQGGPGAAFNRPKLLLLLAYLALEGTRDRRHLSALFFGGAQDPHGSLRTAVRQLRQAVPGLLVAERDRLAVQLACDATDLLSALDAGREEHALGLYTGGFLMGGRLPELGVELEEWVYATREYLAGRVRSALLTLAERAAGQGDFEDAGAFAERAAWLPGAREPEPEDYQRLGALLAAAQSPLLGRLRQQASELGLRLDGRPDEARAILQRPAPTDPAPAALPTRGTSFVGRAVERGEVLRAVARPEVRLLTLVGPGGIGKTRLALEVARSLHTEQEVAFVSLEAVTALSNLPTMLATAVGVSLPAERPAFEALVAVLRPRRLLLVLDSVEHLLHGASWLSRLLTACPEVKVLVTSREALGLEEEWVLTLGGLSVPADTTPYQAALHFGAVELFGQRAQRARLDFELTPQALPAVLQVCRLVGGSPLGIELAAAWVRLMPASEIATEIGRSLDFLEATHRDVPDRHRSVRAVFDQTWARLTDEERAVLARLSVFRGGFTREAAGRVAGATTRTLSRLVGKALIRVAEGGRYDIHVLLLQFAREQLAEHAAEEQEAVIAHGAYVFDLCQQVWEALLRSQDEKRWLERVEQDIENIRAALSAWLEQGQAETALRCVIALRNAWLNHGRRLREARWWFAQALSSGAALDAWTRERALAMDGLMALRMGDYASARQQLEASLTLTASRGATNPLSLLQLGIVQTETGHLEDARRLFEEAIGQFRSQEDALAQTNIGAALNGLGNLLLLTGELDAALSTFQQALRVIQASGGHVELMLANIGEVYLRLGEWDMAHGHLLRAIQGQTARGYQHGLTTMLKNLALVMIGQGRYQQAALLLGVAEGQQEVLDTVMSPADQAAFERQLAPLYAALPQVALDEARSTGRAMTLEQGVAATAEGVRLA